MVLILLQAVARKRKPLLESHNLPSTGSRKIARSSFIAVLLFSLIGFLHENALAGAVISFEENIWNLGEISTLKKHKHEFVFKNTGDENLVIKNVIPTCGCTTVKPEKTVYKPGEKGFIEVFFNPAGKKRGKFRGGVKVLTNDPQSPHRLRVEAVIYRRVGPLIINLPGPPEIVVAPMEINLGVMKLGQGARFRITIGNKGDENLYIMNLDAPNQKSGLPLYKKPIKKNKKIELTASHTPKEKGKFEEYITISSNDPKRKKIRIRIFGVVE